MISTPFLCGVVLRIIIEEPELLWTASRLRLTPGKQDGLPTTSTLMAVSTAVPDRPVETGHLATDHAQRTRDWLETGQFTLADDLRNLNRDNSVRISGQGAHA